jgi:stage III sporulation protein AA
MITRVSSPVLAMKQEQSKEKGSAEEKVVRWLGERIGKLVQVAVKQLGQSEKIEEIRLRINQPLMIRTERQEYFLTSSGLLGDRTNSYTVTKEDLTEILERITHSSIYAAEEELRQGFFTLAGGHRVGVSGETVVDNGKIRTVKNISALNLRLARQPESKVQSLLPLLLDQTRTLCHTLLVSPPRAGKTTILRLLVRALSDGVPELGLEGQTVGVVDERSEIAGMWQGAPAFDLGCRTDVLDRCPKAQGVTMLIRSMSPAVIAVDEIGGPDEVLALNDAVRCGVRILATAHAGNLEELKRRPYLRQIFEDRIFERAVILSRARGPGTIEEVCDLTTGSRQKVAMNRRLAQNSLPGLAKE